MRQRFSHSAIPMNSLTDGFEFYKEPFSDFYVRGFRNDEIAIRLPEVAPRAPYAYRV